VDRAGCPGEQAWDETLTATTSRTSAGLSGAMGLAFGSPAYIEDFCWGCP